MHVLMFVFIHIFCPFLVELKITSFMSMHIVLQMCAAFYISRHIWWLYKASYGHLIPQVFLRSILEASTVITNSGRFNVTHKKMLIFFCRKTGCLFRWVRSSKDNPYEWSISRDVPHRSNSNNNGGHDAFCSAVNI